MSATPETNSMTLKELAETIRVKDFPENSTLLESSFEQLCQAHDFGIQAQEDGKKVLLGDDIRAELKDPNSLYTKRFNTLIVQMIKEQQEIEAQAQQLAAEEQKQQLLKQAAIITAVERVEETRKQRLAEHQNPSEKQKQEAEQQAEREAVQELITNPEQASILLRDSQPMHEASAALLKTYEDKQLEKRDDESEADLKARQERYNDALKQLENATEAAEPKEQQKRSKKLAELMKSSQATQSPSAQADSSSASASLSEQQEQDIEQKAALQANLAAQLRTVVALKNLKEESYANKPTGNEGFIRQAAKEFDSTLKVAEKRPKINQEFKDRVEEKEQHRSRQQAVNSQIQPGKKPTQYKQQRSRQQAINAEIQQGKTPSQYKADREAREAEQKADREAREKHQDLQKKLNAEILQGKKPSEIKEARQAEKKAAKEEKDGPKGPQKPTAQTEKNPQGDNPSTSASSPMVRALALLIEEQFKKAKAKKAAKQALEEKKQSQYDSLQKTNSDRQDQSAFRSRENDTHPATQDVLRNPPGKENANPNQVQQVATEHGMSITPAQSPQNPPNPLDPMRGPQPGGKKDEEKEESTHRI